MPGVVLILISLFNKKFQFILQTDNIRPYASHSFLSPQVARQSFQDHLKLLLRIAHIFYKHLFVSPIPVEKIQDESQANSNQHQEKFIEYYGQLIDEVKAIHPDATIYVQSILPVTAAKSSDPLYSNDKIDSYNQALLELTKEKQVYYLNVAEAFKDENGNLPDEASPKDGMHFGVDYYTKWFDYLKTHTVEGITNENN